MDHPNQQATTPQAPSPQQINHYNWLRTLTIGFGIVSIGIAIAVGGYILGTKKSEPAVENKVVSQPSLIPVDEISNWQTYANITTNYLIKYPSAWVEGPYGSSYPIDKKNNPLSQYAGIYDKSLKNEYLNILSGPTTNRDLNCWQKEEEKEISLGDLKAKESTLFIPESKFSSCKFQRNTKLTLIDLEKQGIKYSLSFYIQDKNLINKIISTFGIVDLNDIDNWKVYINAKYRFSFKHPYLDNGGAVMSGPLTGDVDESQSYTFSDRSTVKMGTDAPFNGFNMLVVFNNAHQNFEDYVSQEKQVLSTNLFCGGIDRQTPLTIDRKQAVRLTCKNGGDTFIILFPDNQKLLIFNTDEVFKGSFDKIFNQILSTLKFTN